MNDATVVNREKTLVEKETELSVEVYNLIDQKATENSMTVSQVIGVLEGLKQTIFNSMK